MHWWDPLLAAFVLLITFGFVFFAAELVLTQTSGWLFTQRSNRNLMASATAALLGPPTAGAIGSWMGGVGAAGFWGPLVSGYVLVGLGLAWGWSRMVRSPGWPPDLHAFLLKWERLGLGEPPVVEVQIRPGIVRLRFPDATELATDASRLIVDLEDSLAPDYGVVVWVGQQRVRNR